MATRRWGFALVCLFCLVAGCADVRDISEQAPYPKFIGTTDKLTRECQLWRNGHSTQFAILVPTVPLSTYGIEGHEYAMLPAGTEVVIEGFQRESDKNGHGYDYAVVSLDDPKHPKRRIHAGVRFEFLEALSTLHR
jgi:hypothetical protein